METEATEALQKFSDSSGLGLLVEQYWWYFIVLTVLLCLRQSVENLLAGASVFLGSEYTENQTVYLTVGGQRRGGRISKCGVLSTTFYLYDIDPKTGVPTGGTLLNVSNSELKNLLIERQLDKLDLSNLHPKQEI